ncbi:hypothetical protein N9424_02820 [Gammaproteobacteria bacterium]|jgi:hypothetical protein|nr:hypothetical protein [Gammaproteobacteria bacterium]
MELNWTVIGWIIDMILNGIIWFIIVAFLITLIDVTDKWTRKAIIFIDVADKWIRKFLDDLFEWIQDQNLKILFTLLCIIILGILSQLEIIPKLIT